MNKILIFLKKIKNTFLTPKWDLVYSNYDNFFIKNKSNKNFFLFLSKFWFFPYDLQPKYWYNVNEKSSHSFVGYKNLNQDAKLLLNQVKKYSLNKNSKILDLGCNVGRHLNFLKKFGFNNLHGVDIGKVSVHNSKRIFVNLKSVNIKCASFENFLYKTKDASFEIIYTHGATIELTKPTFPIVYHLSRVLTKAGYLILLINENGHTYPRFWRYEFKRNNLMLIYNKKLSGNNTLFVLKK